MKINSYAYTTQKLLFLFIGLFSLTTSAQNLSLTEQLDGAETQYEMVWEANELNIIDQGIYKRGLSRWRTDGGLATKYGWGYGYGLETFRLEFMTNDQVETIDVGDKRARKNTYEITLFDSDNTPLLKKGISQRDIVKYTNGGDLITVSVNLQTLPLIVLNKTRSINIAIVEND